MHPPIAANGRPVSSTHPPTHSARDAVPAFNHDDQSSNAEQEYDRLRDFASDERNKHRHLASSAREAYYQSGDGAEAYEMSMKFTPKADQCN